MDPYLTNEQVDDLEKRTWASRKAAVSPEEAHALIREVVRLRGQEAMLTDAVVMAAGLWFKRIPPGRERDYASECLHETAVSLVKENPRLKGAFPTDDSAW